MFFIRRTLRRRIELTGAALVGTLLLSASAFSQSASASKGEIKVGNFAPYSGPASAYSAIAKSEAAYFRMLNAKGGVNGRSINFISYDDAYSPPKAVEQARKLVESDGVLFIFSGVGTPSNTAVMKYMNAMKVPQLLSATAASKFADPKNFPWTMGWGAAPYNIEAALYAKYILDTKPDAKIALLYPNDDFGRDMAAGFKSALGDKASKLIIVEATHETADASIDTHILKLRASGADVLANFTTPRFAALTIRKVAELGWKPMHVLGAVSNSITAVLKPAGLENATGVISMQFFKEPLDARWKDDPGVREYLEFMDTWYKEGDRGLSINAFGYAAAQLLQEILKRSGDDLSRENIMRQATSLENVTLGLLLPGITINTSPSNYAALTQGQMVSFNGESWEPMGPVVGVDPAQR